MPYQPEALVLIEQDTALCANCFKPLRAIYENVSFKENPVEEIVGYEKCPCN